MKINDYKKLVKVKEKPRQEAILDYLARRPGKYWRNNVGLAVFEGKKGKRFVRFGVNGQADITGIRDGRRIEIETKTDDNELSLDQEMFRYMILSEGGLYFVARSVDDVIREGF